MRAVLVLAALAGCATGYGAMGFKGGYEDSRLGDGRYLIRVSVNGYTSSGTAVSYFHRRAAELCAGGYDVESGNVTDNYSGYYVRNRYGASAGAVNKPEVTGVVRCRETATAANTGGFGSASAPPASATDVGSSSIFAALLSAEEFRREALEPGGPGWWCIQGDLPLGNRFCQRTQEHCQKILAAGGPGLRAECNQWNGRVACFSARNKMYDKYLANCLTTISDCEASKKWQQENLTADNDRFSACAVVE